MPLTEFLFALALAMLPGILLVWSNMKIVTTLRLWAGKALPGIMLVCHPCVGFWCAIPGSATAMLIWGRWEYLFLPFVVTTVQWMMLPYEVRNWRRGNGGLSMEAESEMQKIKSTDIALQRTGERQGIHTPSDKKRSFNKRCGGCGSK